MNPLALHLLAQAATTQAPPEVPVPLSTQWASTLLLTILWIFVAAAIAGPLLRFFKWDGSAARDTSSSH